MSVIKGRKRKDGPATRRRWWIVTGDGKRTQLILVFLLLHKGDPCSKGTKILTKGKVATRQIKRKIVNA